MMAVAIVIGGCESIQSTQSPPPDCSWSERCVKRIVKTTHFDESTEMVDVTYYDEKERLIRDIRDYGTEYSSGGVEYEYDDAGDLVTKRFVDRHGKTESLLRYYYDSKHRVIKRVGVYAYPHENNSTLTYEYNDTEHTMVKRTDHDTDGKYEAIEYYWYDASGHKIKEEHDIDADGHIELLVRYDEHGNKIESRADMDDDNIMEDIVISQNVYDAKGRLIVSRHDTDNDGVFEDTITYTYDSEGHIASVTASGERTTYRYDVHDRLTEVAERSRGGSVRIEKARYNDGNNTLEIVSDYEGDGATDDRMWCQWEIDYYDNRHHEKEAYLMGKTWTGKGCYVWPIDRDSESGGPVIPGIK